MWGYPHFPPCLCLYLCPKPALSSCSIPRPDPGGQNCATVEGAKLREILAFLARETAKQTPLSQKVLWKIWWGKSWGRRASNAVYKPTQAQVHPNLRLHDTDTKKPSEAMIDLSPPILKKYSKGVTLLSSLVCQNQTISTDRQLLLSLTHKQNYFPRETLHSSQSAFQFSLIPNDAQAAQGAPHFLNANVFSQMTTKLHDSHSMLWDHHVLSLSWYRTTITHSSKRYIY